MIHTYKNVITKHVTLNSEYVLIIFKSLKNQPQHF